jgi:hypothetical protein
LRSRFEVVTRDAASVDAAIQGAASLEARFAIGGGATPGVSSKAKIATELA